MLSPRRLVTLAAPITCAAILMCGAAAFGQFEGDGIGPPPVPEGPAAPTEFVAHPGNDTVLLQWNPSTGPNLVGYKVYRSLTSGGDFELLGTTEDEWYPDNDVDNETTYYYKVRAYDIYNRQGPPTPEQEAEPLARYPTVAITYPTGGTINGWVDVTFEGTDAHGPNPGLVGIWLLVDAEPLGAAAVDLPVYRLHTNLWENSSHVLQAKGTDLDGDQGWGVPIEVATDNFISAVAASTYEVSPNGDGNDDTVQLQAVLQQGCDWVVEVRDMTDGLVADFEGSGALISCVWDGMPEGLGEIEDGLFKVKYKTVVPSDEDTIVVGRSVVDDDDVEVFACAGPGLEFNEWPWRLEAVRQAARARGLPYKTLAAPLATWSRVSNILGNGVCCVFLVDAHGGRGVYGGHGRTYFNLVDGSVFSYPVGGPYHDVASLGLEDSGRMKFVWVFSCKSGYYDDMAAAFGMYSSDNFMYMDQTYVGWYGPSYQDATYTAFNTVFWQRFSAGYTAYQSLWWAGWGVSWEVYDNTRSYGYPMTTWMP